MIIKSNNGDKVVAIKETERYFLVIDGSKYFKPFWYKDDCYQQLEKLEVQSRSLEKSNGALTAHCELMRQSLSRLNHRLEERFEFVLGEISTDLQAEWEKATQLQNQVPEQSLAEVQIQAVNDFCTKIGLFDSDQDCIDISRGSLIEFVEDLQKSAGKKASE